MKPFPFESRLKELSIDMWIIKIRLKMRKLWPFKVGTNFQTRSTIAIGGNKLNKGVSRKVAIFSIMIMKNTLEYVIVVMNLPREKHESL